MRRKLLTDSEASGPVISHLFLDSGAYSAMTRNTEIDIDEYIKFIKQHEDLLFVYANLDVIGSGDKSFENQQYIEKHGLRPLPIYHYGDRTELLEHYIENYDYIGLGGAAGRLQGPRLKAWLDKIWGGWLVNDDGTAKIRVHGFGITAVPLLIRYPWYSADSIAWIRSATLGGIFVPRRSRVDPSKLDFNRPPHVVWISERSPLQKEEGKHFNSLSPSVQQVIRDYIREQGTTVQELATHYIPRARLNALFFRNFAANRKDPTFLPKKHHRGLFS